MAIEVLFLGGYGPDAARIVRALRARGDDLQLVGGDALGMDEFWKIAGEAGAGTLFSARPEPNEPSVTAERLDRLLDNGVGSRTGELGWYAAVQVWAQAVARAGTLDMAAVARMLHRGRFDTVLGKLSFDRKGDLQGASWQWRQWTNGSHVPLGGPPPESRVSGPAPSLAATGRP